MRMEQGLTFRVEEKWVGKKRVKEDKKERWMKERG
jgi:hypothetical protein